MKLQGALIGLVTVLSACGDATRAENGDAGNAGPVALDAASEGLLDAGSTRDAASPATSDGSTSMGNLPAVDASSSDSGLPSAAGSQGSAGCGQTGSPASGTYTLDVDGTERKYILTLPNGYDPSKPYRLIFAWHGLGGTAEQVSGAAFGGRFGYYGLQQPAADSAIFVAGQGLDTGMGGAGWPNTGGRDVAFVRKLLDSLNAQYCVDQDRIFSVGMSYGGIMSNTLGCQMGDVFRAIAPMSGMGPRVGGFGAACTGEVAVWLSHGNTDSVVSFASGQASRDYWAGANHCQTDTTPTTPSPCVAYQGCDDGLPVTWCEFDGGHTVPDFASTAIWSFFAQF